MLEINIPIPECSIEDISSEEALAFVALQESDLSLRLSKKHSICLGVVYQNALVGVGIFSAPQTLELQAKYRSELVLLQFHSGVTVPGAVTLLLKEFLAKAPVNLLVQTMGDSYIASAAQEAGLRVIAGTSSYEWHNPKVRFYLYKITSAIDSGYYIGRHTLRGNSVSLKDCEEDPYMGSGGRKFKNWRDKPGQRLIKTVVGLYPTWEAILEAEARAIGDLYKTDRQHCKNGAPGGLGNGAQTIDAMAQHHREGICSVHGKVTFFGSSCVRCRALKSFSHLDCAVHGKTVFRGSHCLRCVTERSIEDGICRVHGSVKIRAGVCYNCMQERVNYIAECPTHGLTKFKKDRCMKCWAATRDSIGICPTHGRSKHQGEICYRCNAEKSIAVKRCAVHGDSTFRGNSCSKCLSAARRGLRDCPIHGLTKHNGKTCNRCAASNSFSQGECVTHGTTKFNGDKCCKCSTLKRTSLSVCSTHGEAKFQNDKCIKCSTTKLITLKECPSHGLRKHRGDTCYGCVADKISQTRASKVAKSR